MILALAIIIVVVDSLHGHGLLDAAAAAPLSLLPLGRALQPCKPGTHARGKGVADATWAILLLRAATPSLVNRIDKNFIPDSDNSGRYAVALDNMPNVGLLYERTRAAAKEEIL